MNSTEIVEKVEKAKNMLAYMRESVGLMENSGTFSDTAATGLFHFYCAIEDELDAIINGIDNISIPKRNTFILPSNMSIAASA
jgi:hypothetical protein